ncbi:MAG: Lsm family RNA-binding protein [Nitrososphaeria archaeon]|nr:Lsm family RNA-binding protein [Nitrososphaeria archaeon]
MSIAGKKFAEELANLVGKKVNVETVDGLKFSGELSGISENLNIILSNVVGGENVSKVVINGNFVKRIELVEKLFDLKALAMRLEKYFPNNVKLMEELGTILVMDKIKVTEKGVEGTGLATVRVREIYEEYLRETAKRQ